MKKPLALILAFAMSSSLLLAGCGGSSASGNSGSSGSSSAGGTGSGSTGGSDSSGSTSAGDGEVQDVSLKVWVPEEELEITQQMADSFAAAHPEYNLTWDISVVGIDESVNMLDTDSDTAADVFQVPSGSIISEVQKGLLLPIGYDEANIRSMYGQGALDAASGEDGLLYGIPFSPNSFFMFYNKSMYTEDEVKSLETMMNKDLGDDVYNFSCTIHDAWYIESFFYAAGCTLFGPDGNDPTSMDWNNENGYAAGEYLVDLVANPKYIENTDGIALSLMADGKLAAFCSGTWSAVDVIDAIGEENYGACALPTININGSDSQLRNFGDYKCYSVKSSTAYPLAAQQFAEWLCNEENQKIRYEVNAVTPTILSLESDPMLDGDPATAALMAQSEYYVAQPSISQISEYWTPAAALGDGIVNGQITRDNLQQSLDSLVDSVTSKLVE